MPIKFYCFIQLYLSVLTSAGIMLHADYIKRSETIPQKNQVIELPPKMLASFKKIYENSFRQLEQLPKNYTNGFFSQNDMCYACKVSYLTQENNTSTANISPTPTFPTTNKTSKNEDIPRYIILPYNNTTLRGRPDVICSNHNDDSDDDGAPRVETYRSMDEWKNVRDLFLYGIFGTVLVSIVIILLLVAITWKLTRNDIEATEKSTETPKKGRSKYNMFTNQTSTITSVTQTSSCPSSPCDDGPIKIKISDIEGCDTEKELENELEKELETNDSGGCIEYNYYECIDEQDENYVDGGKAWDVNNIGESSHHSNEVLSSVEIYNRSQGDTLEKDSKKRNSQSEESQITSNKFYEKEKESTEDKTINKEITSLSNDNNVENKIKPKIPPKTLEKTWKKVQSIPSEEHNSTEKNKENDESFKQSFKLTLPHTQQHKITLETPLNPENHSC